MAGARSARSESGAGNVDDWMGDRWAHLERIADGAHEAGQRIWSESTRAGGNLAAPRASDVVALGMRPARQPAPAPILSPEMLELRRHQAAFKDVTRELDRENRWMAAIALAPIAAVGGLEAATFSAARQLAEMRPGEPLQLPGRAPLLKRGDTYYARLGRREDKVLGEKVNAKPGWKFQPRERRDGKLLIPDVKLPVRTGRVPKYLEQKPDSPSGRRAGADALEKYKDLGKTRIIYYRRGPPK